MYLDKNKWINYNNYVWHPYTQEKTAPYPLPVISAFGTKIRLSSGEKLIDAISSWWVMCHGYNHQYIIDKMKMQMDSLSHVMFSGIAHEPAYLLSKKLIEILPTGLSKVFYSDSGSIAVEIAIKIALQFWINSGNVRKKNVISFINAYHGDSFLTMQLSDNNYHSNFTDKNNIYKLKIPNNDESIANFKSFIENYREDVAALIIEPLMQAAGGIIFHNSEILLSIYNICKDNDILFIADEIATGFGRTGSMFACTEANITPDIICIGKALTGGMISLAATVTTQYVYSKFYDDDIKKAFMHGPTYMANPLACSAAIASIELFSIEDRLSQIANIEERLKTNLAELKNIDNIIDVRIKGAVAAIEVNDDYFDLKLIQYKLIENGIWLRPIGNVIYLMPPFIITNSEIDHICNNIIKLIKLLNLQK